MEIGHVQAGGVGVLAPVGIGGKGGRLSPRLEGVQILADLVPHRGQQGAGPAGHIFAVQPRVVPVYGFIGAQGDLLQIVQGDVWG